MSDFPMREPPPYPADDEDKPGGHSIPILGYDEHFIRPVPIPPPPDVWEFYMRHGRWPEPDEA